MPGVPPRIIIIKNTLELSKMYISETIWEERKDKNNISYNKYWEKLKFDKDGNFRNNDIKLLY